jgi:RNA recognition motif-containing protein
MRLRLSLRKKEYFMEIFVGNLAYTATDQDVRQLFEPYGAVERVHIPQDRETGRPRGFGFVTMPDTTEARAAIDGLQGATLGGRALSVNEARPREDRGGPQRGSRRPRG